MFSLACLLTEWKSLCLILPPETITMNRRQTNGTPPSPSLRKSLSNKDDGCFVGCFGSCWCTPFSNTSIDDHLLPLFAFYSISVGPTSSAAASDRYHRQKTEGSSFQKMGNLLQLDSSQFHWWWWWWWWFFCFFFIRLFFSSLSLCDDEFFPKKVRTSIVHPLISCAKNNPLLLLHSTKASLLLRQLLCKRIFIRHSSSGDSSAKDLHKHSSSAALLENIIFTDTLLQELQFSNRNLHSSSFLSCTMKNL